MLNISSTEFEKKCQEILPTIEEKVKEKAPNVQSINQFYELEDVLRLNLRVEYKDNKDSQLKHLPLKVSAQHVMDDKIDAIADAIVNAVS